MADTDKGIIPYYPYQKYLDKNWASEKTSLDDLAAIAGAQVQAEHAGIMNKDLSAYFLPNILKEGRGQTISPAISGLPPGYALTSSHADYGVNDTGYNDPNDPLARTTSKMNIHPIQFPKDITSNSSVTFSPDTWNARNAANLAAAEYASKGDTHKEAVLRWNGQGPMAREHLANVEKIKQMLDHPKNAEIKKNYLAMLEMERKKYAPGINVPSNIPLDNWDALHDKQGNYVSPITYQDTNGVAIIPMVSPFNHSLGITDAIQHYYHGGYHFGIFKDMKFAEAHLNKLSQIKKDEAKGTQ